MAAITVEQRAELVALFLTMFGQAPTTTQLARMVTAREAGGSLLDIATSASKVLEDDYALVASMDAESFGNYLVSSLLASDTPTAARDWAKNWVVTQVSGTRSKIDVLVEAVQAIRTTTNPNYASAKAALAADVTAALTGIDNPIVPPSTFTLTSGVDLITGTGGDDQIIADNTGANKALSVADQINGGAGTDTLKIYLAAADTATGQPTLSGIEEVYLNGGSVTAYTAATGTTRLIIDNPTNTVTATTYTIGTKELSLTNRTAGANTVTTVATAGATSTTTSLKSWSGTNTFTNTLDYSTASLATLNLVTTGGTTGGSSFALTNTGGGLTELNASGDASLTISAAPAAIVTVNASGMTGAINYTAGTAAATFKFTGGSGNDTIAFADNGLAALVSGSQLNAGSGGTADKISILDTALTNAETAIINQAVGFEVLGLNANITLDASTLTSIKSFSIDTTALTQTISNLSSGSTTTITAAAPTSLTLGTAVGVNDTNIVLGSATTGGITVGTLVTTGITNVTLTANGTGTKAITTLTNSDNSNFVIKGAGALTMTLSAGTAVGSKIDGSAATGVLTLSGSNLTGSGDIIIGGAGNDILDGRSGADTLTGGAGVDTFSFNGAAAANASGAIFGQADVITDFVVGVDKLQFAGVTDVVSGQQGAVQNAVTALAAGSTEAQIATAMATANTTNLGVAFAVFEGNTYVLFERTGTSTGVAADDVFIKLTGVTTLPTFAVDVIA